MDAFNERTAGRPTQVLRRVVVMLGLMIGLTGCYTQFQSSDPAPQASERVETEREDEVYADEYRREYRERGTADREEATSEYRYRYKYKYLSPDPFFYDPFFGPRIYSSGFFHDPFFYDPFFYDPFYGSGFRFRISIGFGSRYYQRPFYRYRPGFYTYSVYRPHVYRTYYDYSVVSTDRRFIADRSPRSAADGIGRAPAPRGETRGRGIDRSRSSASQTARAARGATREARSTERGRIGRSTRSGEERTARSATRSDASRNDARRADRGRPADPSNRGRIGRSGAAERGRSIDRGARSRTERTAPDRSRTEPERTPRSRDRATPSPQRPGLLPLGAGSGNAKPHGARPQRISRTLGPGRAKPGKPHQRPRKPEPQQRPLFIGPGSRIRRI